MRAPLVERISQRLAKSSEPDRRGTTSIVKQLQHERGLSLPRAVEVLQDNLPIRRENFRTRAC